jgi:hypothetical protein
MCRVDAEQMLHVRPFLSVTAGVIAFFVGKVLNQHLAVFRE